MTQSLLDLSDNDLQCSEVSLHDPMLRCHRQALRVVTQARDSTAETYAQCMSCADHSVRNRGFRYVGVGEEYILSPLDGMPYNKTAAAPAPALNNGAPALDIEAAPEGSEDQLAKITRIAERQSAILDRIAEKEQELMLLRAELKINQETDLPEALTQANMRDFTLADGRYIGIEKVTAASISEERKGPAFGVLEALGRGSLIKHQFVISFDRKDEKEVQRFLKMLEAENKKRKTLHDRKKIALKKIKPKKGVKKPRLEPVRLLEFERKASINSRSLAKFVRENDALTEDDENKVDLQKKTRIPGGDWITYEKLFGVFRVTKAVMHEPEMAAGTADIPL